MQFRIVIIIILYIFYVILYKISGENLAKIGKKKKKYIGLQVNKLDLSPETFVIQGIDNSHLLFTF